MKKSTLLIAIYLIANIFATNAQNTDIRQVSWGMKMAEVKKLEKASVAMEKTDKLFYKVEVAGYSSTLNYLFNQDDKLYRSRYLFNQMHEDVSVYIDDYATFQNLLKKKYGLPEKDEVICASIECKHDRELWILALRNNELSLVSQWRTDATNITLKLVKGVTNVILVIEYESLAVTRRMKDDIVSAALRDL